MLTADLMDDLQAVQAADLAVAAHGYSRSSLCINSCHYDTLLGWEMEVRLQFEVVNQPQLIATFHFHMEELRCSSATRYLAKLYTDVFLTSVEEVPTDKLQLLGIAAIRLAIKFNESYDYHASLATANTGSQYTVEQVLEAERQLLIKLRFRLKFTTPYCYLRIIKELVPVVDEAIFSRLELLIDYCTAAYQFVGLSSGQLLFSALLFLLKTTSQLHHQQIVLAVASRWPNIQQIASRIGSLLQNDLQHPAP